MRAVHKSDESVSNEPSMWLLGADLDYAVQIIETVCALAGPPNYVANLRASARKGGLIRAVEEHNTPFIFEWFVKAASFQGISDSVARGYMAKHGHARWEDMTDGQSQDPHCPKLQSYWQFYGCKYQKGSGICAHPELISDCSLPRMQLRNGNLNQLAQSLFLFIRDVANGDLVSWIDSRLASVEHSTTAAREERLGQALIDPLRNVFGISDKVLNMVLASILLGAGERKPGWIEAGANLIAVDSLVHNFFVRTGILKRAAIEHPYGPQCYGLYGCSELLRTLGRQIDCRRFNTSFPAHFPRFVQSAIWHYCAADRLNVCNGNQIDDSGPCQNRNCRIYEFCDRFALAANKKAIFEAFKAY